MFEIARHLVARRSLTIAALLFAPRLGAQTAAASPPFSIGQPTLWPQSASVLVPLDNHSVNGAVWAAYEIQHPLINPVTGLLSVGAEGYAAIGEKQYGVRGLTRVPAFGIAGGVDWSIATGNVSPVFAFQTAVRRGGIIGHGSMLRVDWLPGRGRTFALGLTVPTFRPLAGRTRPRKTHVRLGDVRRDADVRIDATDDTALYDAAGEIAAFSNVYSQRAERIAAAARINYHGVLRRYDDAIQRLFGDATIARRARNLLFDDVVLPMDSLFGQAKGNPRDLGPLMRASARRMGRWLADSSRLDAPRRAAAERAYGTLLRTVERVNADLLGDAGDSRLVWLPVELALTADQFDEQSEVDSLLARAVGHPFTDQNALTYLRSTDLPLEIARSIYAARHYHVLWTHDFTGRTDVGAIDNIAYSMVADAYYPALTAAVKRYDSTGVMPTYMILQDEFFYEPRDNRLWMDILENPLDATIRMRGDTTPAREEHLRQRQEALRAAVAQSARLQHDARASGDAERWLRGMIKVHVNIVEPYDFSFRSSRIIPGIPFAPDNIMRDHRKLVFYDLDESDPYRGAMLIMGIGIGEHYASATWEDRGYRVRGPATLEVRRALRNALLRNGYSPDQIPPPLRSISSTTRAERRMNAGDYVGRALMVNNEVGFDRKESSIARALLYNLTPPGSDIIVPDPMWLSRTWAGMLAGAAARGCRVYVIAPAAANAPSPQAPLMALQHDVLGRLLALRQSLSARIAASGGDLRVGIFAAKANVDDASGRIREIRDGVARSPWIREVIPFDAKTLAVLEGAERAVANQPNATILARDAKPREPQLHQKSQLIARPGAIAALVRQPGWDVVLANNVRTQAAQTAKFEEQFRYSDPDVDTSATRSTDAMLRGYEQTLPEAERKQVSFYFSLGSQNQDPRGIASDAESTLLVSGVAASVGLVDLYFLMARSDWITTEAQLSRYNPAGSALMQRLGRWLAAVF
jgi:hypothetical protein